MEENKVMEIEETTELAKPSESNIVKTDDDNDSMLPGLAIGGGITALIMIGAWKIKKYRKKRKAEKEELEYYRKQYGNNDDTDEIDEDEEDDKEQDKDEKDNK